MTETQAKMMTTEGKDLYGFNLHASCEIIAQNSAHRLRRTRNLRGTTRQLDDAELESGDDDGRNDRMQVDDSEKEEEDVLKRELNIRETSFGRHSIPRGSDGEVSISEDYSATT